jgi:hypothetical protein
VSGPTWSRALLPWRASLGAVIVATEHQEPVLEGSAAAVWELLEEPRLTSEVVAQAREAYGLDEVATIAALDALAAARLCRST